MRQKRLIYFSGMTVIMVILAGILVYRYLPLRKFLHFGTGDEHAFSDTIAAGTLPPNSLFFDFEVAPGAELPKGIVKGEAHSGEHASKAFGKNSFAYQVERTAGEIGTRYLDKVGLSAWLYLFPGDNDVNANLVFAAFNESGVNICWKSRHVAGPEIPRGRWFKISGEIDLREYTFKPDYRIQIYFWNNSDNDFLVDDYMIVFGSSPPRRGDSARVNLTLPEGYVSRFNYPPFKPLYFIKRQATFNMAGEKGKATFGPVADIGPGDLLTGGYFLSNPYRLDILFAIDTEKGTTFMMAWCSDKREMMRFSVDIPWSDPRGIAPRKLLHGRFTGAAEEELLLLGKEQASLIRFSGPSAFCEAASPVTATILWEGMIADLTGIPDAGTEMIAGDFNGDAISELLIPYRGGWRLCTFSAAGEWETMAGKQTKKAPWSDDPSILPVLHSGKFLAGIRYDQVLAIMPPPSGGYTLLRWDAANRDFRSCLAASNSSMGAATGLDTLKITDLFFTGSFLKGESGRVIRLNRDWRFDLKLLSFSAEQLEILYSLDFEGYEKDFNPKYYEVFIPVAGCFLSPDQEILLIHSTNCREWDEYGRKCRETENLYTLPDRTSLYILQKP